jgi:hypothetical protein
MVCLDLDLVGLFRWIVVRLDVQFGVNLKITSRGHVILGFERICHYSMIVCDIIWHNSILVKDIIVRNIGA